MEDFYHRLSYSFGNEDWETERKALRIKKGDRVVCVTASGDRPLNILTEDCESIVSVDTNPMQNALLDLKKVAIRDLDYDGYLRFMGMEPCKSRLATYRQLSDGLTETSRKLWKSHMKLIKRGVLFEGAIEKKTKIASVLLRLMRRKVIDQLFQFDDVQEQMDYVERSFDTKLWRKTMNFCLSPRLTKIFVQDPGLYEFVDPEIHVARHLHDCIQDALSRFPAKESPLLSMFLRGNVDYSHLPPYLLPDGVERIRPKLEQVQVETDDLISFLERSPENSYDCFSLSDVASYISYDTFKRMMAAAYRCARPGARFSIRQFLTRYEIPEEMSSHFVRDLELEKSLALQDRYIVYSFMAGEIKKT